MELNNGFWEENFKKVSKALDDYLIANKSYIDKVSKDEFKTFKIFYMAEKNRILEDISDIKKSRKEQKLISYAWRALIIFNTFVLFVTKDPAIFISSARLLFWITASAFFIANTIILILGSFNSFRKRGK